MMKFFNTAGPVNQNEHYKIDPLKRWDLDEIQCLIDQKKYFILHAPRQTGKTSCLLALRDHLNAEGKYYCVYANFEAAQTARNDVVSGIETVIQELHSRCQTLNCPLPDISTLFNHSKSHTALNLYLNQLSSMLDKPLILFIDEIDALIGDTLVSVLRQLRSGYDQRPETFPQSIILCGVRDIKDYRIHRSDGEIITGGSCFNIKAESLSLGNFSEAEVRELYEQHTIETGQLFEEKVFPLVMEYTAGQPWLVNALGYEVTFKMKENRDRSVVITPELMEEAKERLILSRATHLDQLADKLKEPRVRNVVEPLLIGENPQTNDDDVEYCTDLGLVRKEAGRLIISNAIYREILPRELTNSIQRRFAVEFNPDWVKPDGSIDAQKLIEMFVQFWHENGEIWSKDVAGYTEAAPHLVFQGFLQRVANGAGIIEREYALGRKRCDLMLKWRSPKGEQRIVIELKVRTERQNTPAAFEKLKQEGIEQTLEYAQICNADVAYLLIFDRRENSTPEEKYFTETITHNNHPLTIIGL